jgi:CHAT domain-containing protein
LKPDDHDTWHNRGVALGNSGRYEEAIASYDKAIELKPDDHDTWYGRGVAIGILHGYQAKIKALHEAFQHIHSETHPKGWGFLHHRIGRTHYDEGKKQLFNHRRSPQIYYGQAITAYQKALQTLTRAEFPKLRLDTLIDTAKVYLAQHNTPAARECQLEALDILRDLLNAQPTFEGKKRLQLEYVSLRQLNVDLFVADGDNIRALEAAELDKNNHLIWLLTALEETTISPSYAQMQQLLSVSTALNRRGLSEAETRPTGNRPEPIETKTRTAIIYWHLSPDNLTTFILHPNQPAPQVLTSPSLHLQTWLKTYDTDNLNPANWQELADILQINEINRHNGIHHLILIPHRDLHRLPLHIYWQQLTTTYLPSIQIGLNLQTKPQPDLAAGLLLIESPAYHAATTQTQKGKSLGILPNAEIEAAILAYLFQPKTIVRAGSVSRTQVQTDLNRPHYYGHYNGHAYHDPRRPQESSLILEGDDVLACEDLGAIDLHPYHLISLSACQTGVTTHQTIDTEYVGLVSAFLSRGTNYVVSTLWSVADLPSSLLMMVFYIYIKKGTPAPLALWQAANWLRELTHAKEAEFHSKIYQWLDPKSSTARSVERNLQNALAAARAQPEQKPYSSPKYWAAFTISGWG